MKDMPCRGCDEHLRWRACLSRSRDLLESISIFMFLLMPSGLDAAINGGAAHDQTILPFWRMQVPSQHCAQTPKSRDMRIGSRVYGLAAIIRVLAGLILG